jgi:Protein of unknown function (DUF2752)
VSQFTRLIRGLPVGLASPARSWFRTCALLGLTRAKRAVASLPYFLVALLLLASMPTEWIASLPVVCPYRNLFGLRCLGCGMTRALSLLLHCQVRDAFAMNPLVALVFPWILTMAARDLATLASFLGARSDPD